LGGGLRGTFVTYLDHLSSARLLATFAVGFGMLFCNVAVFTFVNFYLAAPPFSLTPGQLGMVFVVYLVGLITTPISTALVIRMGRRITVGIAIVLAMVGLALTLLPTLPAVTAGLAAMCGGLFVVQTLSLGYIAATVRRAVSTAVGLYVTSFYIGGALGGIAPAALWQRSGWSGVVALLTTLLLGMLVLASLFWHEGAAGTRRTP
jgi:predicted MFS family arabinose efflux permease